MNSETDARRREPILLEIGQRWHSPASEVTREVITLWPRTDVDIGSVRVRSNRGEIVLSQLAFRSWISASRAELLST